MGEWDGVEAVGLHEWVGCAVGAVDVEFFFEEFVDGRVEGEWVAWWSADSESAVEVEAAGAVEVEVEFGAGEAEFGL